MWVPYLLAVDAPFVGFETKVFLFFDVQSLRVEVVGFHKALDELLDLIGAYL